MELYNEDCFEQIKLIKDASIDLVCTDPPYEFDPSGKGIFSVKSYTNQLDSLGCCSFNPEPFLEMLLPKMKSFYGYFFCNKTLVARYIEWAERHKFKFDILTLIKINPVPAKSNHHLNDTEYIILIRQNGTFFSNNEDFDCYRKAFITQCASRRYHPAEKPIVLIERFIRISSKPGDTILDPFMGSGTTGVACINLGREFIGIERDESYFDTAGQRLGRCALSKVSQQMLF